MRSIQIDEACSSCLEDLENGIATRAQSVIMGSAFTGLHLPTQTRAHIA